DCRGGHRRRHCPRGSGGDLRGVPAGGHGGQEGGGHGPRAGPLPEVHRTPRGTDLGQEHGGRRLDLHVQRAGRSRSASSRPMTCPWCQTETPADADFCSECGAKLALVCGNCSTGNASTHKFCKKCGQRLGAEASPGQSSGRFTSPETYTPKHLAEKILTSKAALEGERKQVTVLFADLKGSMELLADRDPEEARKILDPILEHMMEAVHRYEGTV